MVSNIVKKAWNNPWLLLSMCVLFWGSNVVASRIAAGEVSPILLGFLRWVAACALLFPLLWRPIIAERQTIASHWLYFLLASGAAYTLYSVLFFGAGNLTTGVNMAMLCAIVPVLTIVFAWIFLRMKASVGILAALGLAVAGALVVATHGDLNVLRNLAFNAGDIMMLCASAMHAAYTVSLRNRPPMAPLVFFTVMCGVALVTSIPFAVWEIAAGKAIYPSFTGWMLVLYVGIFPTLLAQLFYMRGVELIGPQRTGLFYNFVPVSGALMAVALLGEPFAWYHAVGFLLVLAGIILAERWRAQNA
jgi:drug/metabolite transporter (DMT)-like permease